MKLTINELAPYFVTKQGDVIQEVKNKKLTQFIDKYGYRGVNLKLKGEWKRYLVHRLVAKVYIPNPDNKPQVNHKDGDKTNNHVDNLEWCTNQENRNHAVLNLLHKHQKYSLKKDNVFLGNFNSSKEIAERFNLDQSAICKVANGRYKHTKGYMICKI